MQCVVLHWNKCAPGAVGRAWLVILLVLVACWSLAIEKGVSTILLVVVWLCVRVLHVFKGDFVPLVYSSSLIK